MDVKNDPLPSGAATSVLTTHDGGDTLQWHDIITDLLEDSSIMLHNSHEIAVLTHGRICEDESTSVGHEACIEEVLEKGEDFTQWYDNCSDFDNISHTSLHQHEVTTLSHEEDSIMESFYDNTQVVGDKHEEDNMDSSHKGHAVVHHSKEKFEGKGKEVEISPHFLCMNNSGMSSLSHDMATFNYGKGSDISVTMVGTHDACFTNKV